MVLMTLTRGQQVGEAGPLLWQRRGEVTCLVLVLLVSEMPVGREVGTVGLGLRRSVGVVGGRTLSGYLRAVPVREVGCAGHRRTLRRAAASVIGDEVRSSDVSDAPSRALVSRLDCSEKPGQGFAGQAGGPRLGRSSTAHPPSSSMHAHPTSSAAAGPPARCPAAHVRTVKRAADSIPETVGAPRSLGSTLSSPGQPRARRAPARARSVRPGYYGCGVLQMRGRTYLFAGPRGVARAAAADAPGHRGELARLGRGHPRPARLRPEHRRS